MSAFAAANATKGAHERALRTPWRRFAYSREVMTPINEVSRRLAQLERVNTVRSHRGTIAAAVATQWSRKAGYSR